MRGPAIGEREPDSRLGFQRVKTLGSGQEPMSTRKIFVWSTIVIAGAITATVLYTRAHRWRPRTISIQGAVIRRNVDPRKELPIAGVTVTATDGMMTTTTQSDASGYYLLKFRENVWPGQVLQLMFRSPGYEGIDLTVPTGLRTNLKKLYVARLTSLTPDVESNPDKKTSQVSNIRIRYTVNTQGDQNIGSVVRTFEVTNNGNIPCNHQGPCSPDGNWKASVGSLSLDAGPGNEFRDVRASCIAGPCPFTRIDSSGFERGGRHITASALDWSDTTTFLLEAEVFRTSINSNVRESYPVIFGRTLNFTLPPTQEGVSIEADIDHTPMVFPLGPELYLSWASCTMRTNTEGERSSVYRCELKPGYRF